MNDEVNDRLLAKKNLKSFLRPHQSLSDCLNEWMNEWLREWAVRPPPPSHSNLLAMRIIFFEIFYLNIGHWFSTINACLLQGSFLSLYSIWGRVHSGWSLRSSSLSFINIHHCHMYKNLAVVWDGWHELCFVFLWNLIV